MEFVLSVVGALCAPGMQAVRDCLMGWDKATVETFTRGCLNEQRDCRNHLLGEGRMLY